MSQVITLLSASDLHRSRRLYSQLGRAITHHRPDLVALTGDFLDATGDNGTKLSTVECAQFLSRLACQEVLFIRGNHEDSAWFTFAEEWTRLGRTPHLLDGKALTYGPLVVIGFPCLMNRGDGLFDDLPTDPSQWLPQVILPVGPAGRTLWLMHEPVHGTSLSRCDGPLSGNIEWLVAVERFAPWLVIFGHDHDTPIRRHAWHHQLPNKTICVNVGQSARGPLRYALITLEFAQACPSLPVNVSIAAHPSGGSIKLPLRG